MTGEDAEPHEIRDHPDVVLGRLAARNVDVHGLVAELISPANSFPNEVHHAVVDLALTARRPRIVTTNWDGHLSAVLANRGWAGDVFRAPALPVGDGFDGLVYLHGSASQKAENLIMTDRDFGRAYLTDAWAARFMARVFTQFKTLFIGYSHDDVVMSYLAQGLRSGSPDRFVLTDVPDSPRWRQLGIVPVEYSPADAHIAMPTAIGAWAAAAGRGALDHAQRTKQLVTERQPDLGLSAPDATAGLLSREEASYLENVLADAALVGLFTSHAKGEPWLRWALTQPVFRRVFTDVSQDDPRVSLLAQWFARTFLGSEEDSNLALDVLLREGGRLRAPLWWAVAGQLSFPAQSLPLWVDRWILLLLRDSGADSGRLLSALLEQRLKVGAPDEIVVLLLDYLLRPEVTLASSYGFTGAPRIEVTLTGEDSTMAHVWQDSVKALLPASGDRLVGLAEQHLLRAYDVVDAGSGSSAEWDPLSYRRAAIEKHPQNAMSGGVDVLIDVTRDSIEALLAAGDERAADRVDRWAKSQRRLLRRLAVHSYGVRTDLDASVRLAWLIDSGWLHDINFRHEAFQLIATTVGDAAPETVDALTNHIAAWPELEGENAALYRAATVGDALAWLLRYRPDHEPSQRMLAHLHSQYDFTESPHPDLLRWTEGGWVAVVPAIGVEELHVLVATDPVKAVSQLVKAGDKPRELGLRELSPTESVRQLAAAYPGDGVKLLKANHEGARDFTSAVTEGWANATLDPDFAAEAAEALADGPLAQNAHAIATLLMSSDRNSQSVRWTRIPAARHLAALAWNAAANDLDYNGSATLSVAVNHAAGQLAEFWIQAAIDDQQADPDEWDGLTDELIAAFDTLLGPEAPEPAKRLAQVVFAANIFALWTIDETWARESLLPLLSWDDEERARATWSGYLTWGRWNDAILNAGLLHEYSRAAKAFSTGDVIDGLNDLRSQLGNHVAAICMNTSVALLAPNGTGFLTDWTHAAAPDIRATWLDSIAWGLRGVPPEPVEQLWVSWLGQYWTMRTQTAPEPLTEREQSALTAIGAHLDVSLPGAADLAVIVPAPIDAHPNILADLASVRIQRHPEAAAKLVAHVLGSTKPPAWAVSASEAQRIIADLRTVTTADKIKPISDAVVALFGAGAADW